MKIMGIDPGFAKIGICILDLTKSDYAIDDLIVLKTEKSAKKKTILASDDNVRRAREISKMITDLMDVHSVKVICAESMSFPRNSSAAAKVSMCWGVISAISQTRDIPILQCSPQQIKIKMCGRKDASKEDIQAAVAKVFENKIDVSTKAQHIVKTQKEHCFDAAAAVLSCLESEHIKLLRSIL